MTILHPSWEDSASSHGQSIPDYLPVEQAAARNIGPHPHWLVWQRSGGDGTLPSARPL